MRTELGAERLSAYACQRFDSAGLSVSGTPYHLEVHIPTIGVVHLNFGSDELSIGSLVQCRMFQWLKDTIFPHIKIEEVDAANVTRSLHFHLKKDLPDDSYNVRMGKGLIVVTWEYTTLSSERVEPLIQRFCLSRGLTYDLDDDRFYVNNKRYHWV